jgi:hypothetical protein
LKVLAIISLAFLALMAMVGIVLMIDWWRSTRFDPVREARKILACTACERRPEIGERDEDDENEIA